VVAGVPAVIPVVTRLPTAMVPRPRRKLGNFISQWPLPVVVHLLDGELTLRSFQLAANDGGLSRQASWNFRGEGLLLVTSVASESNDEYDGMSEGSEDFSR
jgi:hypothetical protein